MKGREAIKDVLKVFHLAPLDNTINKVERILLDAGWLPPETIAKEYVRKSDLMECAWVDDDALMLKFKYTKVADIIGGSGEDKV